MKTSEGILAGVVDGLAREGLVIVGKAEYAALERKLETAVQALKGVRTNVAYAHQPDNCGDHCRNNYCDCVLRNTLEDIDAAISAAEEREG